MATTNTSAEMTFGDQTPRYREDNRRRAYVDLFFSCGKVSFSVDWTFADRNVQNQPPTTVRTMDVIISPGAPSGEHPGREDEITHATLKENEASSEIEIPIAESRTAVSFLLQTMEASIRSCTATPMGVKIIFPSCKGHISRADFFEERMDLCSLTESVASFVAPLQLVQPVAGIGESLVDLLNRSTAAATVRASNSNLLMEKMEALDGELRNRISFPWHLPTSIARKRLAMIHGGYNLEFRRRVLEMCPQFGIDLYVLDKPGHWLQDESFSQFRKAFVPVDLTLDDSLPQRIVDALRGSQIHVDGVTCFSDTYLVTTAKVASLLHLETSPVAAFAKAVDKYETRRILGGDDNATCFSDLEELKHYWQSESRTLKYPLIMKPTQGGGSKGVFKADCDADLYSAAEEILKHKRGPFLLESYIDGPEIDANFILLDGEILFFEVSDNLPCAAEKEGADATDSFLETGMVFPSGLESKEIELIRSSIYKDILKLGFRTGVFHTEARLQNSSMRFEAGEDGTVDIRKSGAPETGDTSVFVIEINARAPGRQATNSATRAYGVDYNAVQLLLALGEMERVRALAQPFKDGPQFWCESVYIAAPRGGVWNSDDAFLELGSRRPDLTEHIAEYHCLFERGQKVLGPESGSLQWILSFVVFSRSSRSQALRLAEVIRSELRYELL